MYLYSDYLLPGVKWKFLDFISEIHTNSPYLKIAAHATAVHTEIYGAETLSNPPNSGIIAWSTRQLEIK